MFLEGHRFTPAPGPSPHSSRSYHMHSSTLCLLCIKYVDNAFVFCAFSSARPIPIIQISKFVIANKTFFKNEGRIVKYHTTNTKIL